MNAKNTISDKTVRTCATQHVKVATKQQAFVSMGVTPDGWEVSVKKNACPAVLVSSVITVVDIALIRQHATMLLELAPKDANPDIKHQTV